MNSRLDQLAWQLALLGNPTPSKDVMFPILSEQKNNCREYFNKRVRDIPAKAVSIIDEIQPYKRGPNYREDPLWQLNELSNLDKHRVPAGRATVAEFHLKPLGFNREDFEDAIEFSWPL